MTKLFFSLLMILSAAFATKSFASDESATLKCRGTRTNACGEMLSVQCDGDGRFYFMSQNQKIISLNVDLNNFDSIHPKAVNGFLHISKPTAPLGEYVDLLTMFGFDSLSSGSPTADEIKNYRKSFISAVQDMKAAAKKPKLGVTFNSTTGVIDQLTLGSFEVSREAKFYKDCQAK